MSTGVQIFVGNLPENCKGDSLLDLFSPYGEITDLTFVKNYAFLTFAYGPDANKAVQDLHKSKMFGKELTVEIAKQKQPRSSGGNKGSGGDRKPQRDDNRRKSSGLAIPPSGFPAPPAGGGGGILGVAPGANLSGGLNLLSAAVNNVVAAAASGRQAPEMFERGDRQQAPNNREPLPSRDPPPSRDPLPPKNLSDGYVIYERYYVDPKHPLLKGLPIPELPRVTDSFVSQDVYQSRDSYAPRQEDHSANDYRERSPLQTRRNLDYDRESSRNYDYFDRR